MTGAIQGITADRLSLFCTTNIDYLSQFDAVILNLHGLNRGLVMEEGSGPFSEFCTQHNLMYVYPYLNPWCWMNDIAVATVDNILDVIFHMYELPESFPVAIAGRSMGGQCALIYLVRGRYHPIACALSCPVCDLRYHYDERIDTARTIFSACDRSFDLDKAVNRLDPMSQIHAMPKIPYYIAHCAQDTKVAIGRHSDVFVRRLQELGHDVRYTIVPGRDHIDLTDSVRLELYSFLADAIKTGS